MSVKFLELSQLRPNAAQPRQQFDEASLDALAASIKAAGVMQPIVVRRATSATPTAAGDVPHAPFEIIAGERRWRAAQRAGLAHIPAVVHNVDDQTVAEWSLIENLQREDLNPMERAEAFRQLADRFSLTHQQIAERIGLDRSTVTNHLRLNELPQTVKDAIRRGALSMGHARALLSVPNLEERVNLANRALREAWSVREMERRTRESLDRIHAQFVGADGNSIAPNDANSTNGAAGSNGPHSANGAGGGSGGVLHIPAIHPHMADLQKRLGAHLGTKVRVQTGRTRGSGRLVIDFYSLDQFEGLMKRLGFEAD